MKEESVIGKFIINGKLHLESPLIIGSGRGELVDIEVLKDETGIPFIPATSIIGVLRHYFEDNFPENKVDDFNYFWGVSQKEMLTLNNQYRVLSSVTIYMPIKQK